MGKRTKSDEFLRVLRFINRRYKRFDTAYKGCKNFIKGGL